MSRDETPARARAHFLDEPERTPEAEAMFDANLRDYGFVMNLSRLWAYQPAAHAALFDLLAATAAAGSLSVRERGVLVTAMASTLGDSYCSIAWGGKLAAAAGDAELAAGVLRGDDAALTGPEQAMARWARTLVTGPSASRPEDVEELRQAGITDDRIFAMTVFVALRMAFSTINGALGAAPDSGFRESVPPVVLDVVTYGRPLAEPVHDSGGG